jgi:glycosyltransferase involved in cell wall biosynthesis
MQVVMVGPFGLRPHGTMSRRALPLAKALAARGHSVEVLLPPWSCPEDSGRGWNEDGVCVCNIVLPASIPLLRDALVVWRLVRHALDSHPQVLHFFKPKGYSGLAAMVVWYMARLRLVTARVVLDSDDREGRGGWNEIGGYSRLEKHLFAWQEAWGMTHCHALTLASRALESFAQESRGGAEGVFYVPNGAAGENGSTDPRTGTRVRAQWALGGDPVVLLLTRFFEFEPRRVMNIMAQVIREMPLTRLLVVGRGLRGEEEGFLASAQEAGVGSRVTYAGWREKDELAGYFAASDLAILPLEDTTLNRARCPAKLADLMAAGLPVVAEDVGQASQYLEHLSSGYLVPAGDSDAFAVGVLRLLRDEELRLRLGRHARERIKDEFTWPKLARVVERAYLG